MKKITYKELVFQLQTSPELSEAVKIKHVSMGDIGIAFLIGENLMENYLSGDVIIFWDDGEHGVMNDYDELWILEENLFSEPVE